MRSGLRFLLVDALCIFQDSVDDWELEAPKMTDTYSHTILAIIATASPSAHAGILANEKGWYLASYHGEYQRVQFSSKRSGFELRVSQPLGPTTSATFL